MGIVSAEGGVMTSERKKMGSGQWYTCRDPELLGMQAAAREACHEHNTMSPALRGALGPRLSGLMAGVGADSFIEAPFHCAYAINIRIGARVYMNAGCTILDTAPVRIGDDTMFGPGVQIYCARHHSDRAKRTAGLETARPVTIGREVWIGGGAIILQGITVADGAIVGAGSVVTRDVPAGATVAGNPARPIGRVSET